MNQTFVGDLANRALADIILHLTVRAPGGEEECQPQLTISARSSRNGSGTGKRSRPSAPPARAIRVFEPDKPKYYVLIEFPYPSGEGLHVGHPRSYTALDVVARKRRMEGYNVLYPIGWDAFGLPTENYAIKTGQHPRDVTRKNVANFRRQLKRLGFSFDWSREVDTTDPAYYKWTQWIFLKLLEKGLAYKAEMPINWCSSCKVGLANEEVVGGECERCGGAVVRRMRKQWMLRITAYAERLLADLDTVDFLEKIKMQQRNWIGRSTGAEVEFPDRRSAGLFDARSSRRARTRSSA